MNLRQCFQKLSYTHLSELPIVGEGSGEIPEEHYPKIIARVNEALLALHARFHLQRKKLTLQTFEGLEEYFLDSMHAVSENADPAFIIDSVEKPFQNDILMILVIKDKEGCEVPLNDRVADCSWFTTRPDTLLIPNAEEGKQFSIWYSAAPEEITFGPGLSLSDTRIPLPRILEPALLAYIAGHIYGNMSMETAMVKSQHFLDMYEMECKTVEALNVLNTSITPTNDRIRENRWP